MKGVVARSYFDAVGDSADAGVDCSGDPSLAVQASRDECDINVIIRKYLRTGELPGLREGVYADLSGLTGLQDAIQVVRDADLAFSALPADVRSAFDNDPVRLVQEAHDESKREKFEKLGLVKAKAAPVQPAVSEKPAAAASQPAPGAVPPSST